MFTTGSYEVKKVTDTEKKKVEQEKKNEEKRKEQERKKEEEKKKKWTLKKNKKLKVLIKRNHQNTTENLILNQPPQKIG